MIHIKVFFANGDSLVTGFNGSMLQACNYYVGHVFQLGISESSKSRAVRIEQL